MACPSCGSDARAEIGPDRFKCLNGSGPSTYWVPPGAPGNVSAAAFPVSQPGWSCGTTYTRAESDAIDRQRELDAAVKRASDEAASRRTAAIADASGPEDRLLRAVAAFVPVVETDRQGNPIPRVQPAYWRPNEKLLLETAYLRVAHYCPKWNVGSSEVGSYRDDLVARWFALFATRTGIAPDSSLAWPTPCPRRSGLRRQLVPCRDAPVEEGPRVPTWKIPGVLLKRHTGGELQHDGHIDGDGRLYTGWSVTEPLVGMRGVQGSPHRPAELVPAARITVPGLVYLAGRLGIEIDWTGNRVRPAAPSGAEN